MTQFEESIAKYHDNYELYEFLLFVKDGLTTKQCKEALTLTDNDVFIQYLLCIYGCYCIPRKMGVPHLITNPQALSLSDEESRELVETIKGAIVEELETVKAMQSAHKLRSKKQ